MKVILIAAMTVCGRISPAGMGSPLDRRLLEEFRGRTGASLIGAGTLRQGDPELRGPNGRLDPSRIRALVTASADIPSGARLFARGPAPLIFTSPARAPELARQMQDRARVLGVATGPAGISVAAVLAELDALGVDSVLLEGGGKLNYAALQEGVVDELSLTLTPLLSGDRHAASLADGHAPLGTPFLALKLISARTAATGEIYLLYQRG